MGVECLDPAPDKVFCLPGRKHDGGVWGDNGVELFLNDPILGSSYFQIIISSDGFNTKIRTIIIIDDANLIKLTHCNNTIENRMTVTTTANQQ